MMLSILSRRFCLSLVNLGSGKKSEQIQIGLSGSKKLCLDLYLLEWLIPMSRQVSKISPFGWQTLKTLILQGLVKFKIFFLKIGYEFIGTTSFHSTNDGGKKELTRKLFLSLNWGRITVSYLVWIIIWRN